MKILLMFMLTLLPSLVEFLSLAFITAPITMVNTENPLSLSVTLDKHCVLRCQTLLGMSPPPSMII